jgi:hypothetical protein
MRFHLDLDLRLQQAHLTVHQANETLHPVEDGLNLKLNSWSLPFDLLFSQTKNIESTISYSLLSAGEADAGNGRNRPAKE